MSDCITRLSEISRERPLNDQEEARLYRAIRREERRAGSKREYWTRDEDSRLRRMVRRGKSPRQIAAVLIGRSEQAVWCRIKFLRHRKQIAYYRPEWAKLRAQGPNAQTSVGE